MYETLVTESQLLLPCSQLPHSYNRAINGSCQNRVGSKAEGTQATTFQTAEFGQETTASLDASSIILANELSCACKDGVLAWVRYGKLLL